MARGSELAVLAAAGDLAQHVFVQIALGVAVFHGDFVEKVDDLGEQLRYGDGEPGTFHMLRVGRIVPAQRAKEGEDVFATRSDDDLDLLIGV